MIELEWHDLPDGYGSGDYLIRRVPDRPRTPWQLDLDERAASWRGHRRFTTSFYSTLPEARDRATQIEQERLTRARAIGHGSVAVIASLVLLAMLPGIDSLGEYLLAVGAIFVAIRSFAFAVSITLGDAWGWPRDRGRRERLTRSDKVVLAVMERLRQRAMNAIDVEPIDTLRTLPPDPPA